MTLLVREYMGRGPGPGVSISPQHLVRVLRREVLLELKGEKLIDAQHLEEQGRLRTAARRTGLEAISFPSVIISDFSLIASYASGFDSEGQKGLPEAGSRFSQYSRLALGLEKMQQ